MDTVNLWPVFEFLLSVVEGELTTYTCTDLDLRIKAAQLYLSYGIILYKSDYDR